MEEVQARAFVKSILIIGEHLNKLHEIEIMVYRPKLRSKSLEDILGERWPS